MTDSSDVLSNNELPALRFLLRFCSQLGPAAEPLNPGQWRSYCGWLSSIDAAYTEIENSTFKTFVDHYLTALMDVPSQAYSGGQVLFKHLYVVYAYSVGCKIGDRFYVGGLPTVWMMNDDLSYFHVHSGTWKGMWDLFTNGYLHPTNGSLGKWARMNEARYIPWSFQYATSPANDPITTWKDGFTNDVLKVWSDEWGDWTDKGRRCVADHAKTAVRRPASPIWKKATDEVLQAWAGNPPPELIHTGSGPVRLDPRAQDSIPDLAYTDGFDAINAAEGVLAKWTDFPAVQVATAPAWDTLIKATKALIGQPLALTSEQYFFLFHLLIALASGDDESQALALRIVSTHTTSVEYKNEIFINQLLYLVLMYLGDPLESANTHLQLQQFVIDCSGIVPGSAAGKQIGNGLARSAKLLQADNSYPLVDPFAAINVQFPARRADTSAALDAARSNIAAAL